MSWKPEAESPERKLSGVMRPIRTMPGVNLFSIQNRKSHSINGKEGLFQIPSFMRIYLAIRKGVGNLGIEKMIHPNSTYYEG